MRVRARPSGGEGSEESEVWLGRASLSGTRALEEECRDLDSHTPLSQLLALSGPVKCGW